MNNKDILATPHLKQTGQGDDRQPSDYAVRERAISVQHSFLIEAPAGSGKTELLTDRILALLAYVQRPEEIVAITFTRKAAAEMHQRVIDKLAAAQQPAPTESYKIKSWQLAQAALKRDKEQGWDLLNYPARLSIRTIDALCAHLVQAMPWSSGLGGVPGIAENAQELYRQAAQNTLLMAQTDNAVGAVLRHLNMGFGRAEELIINMLSKREQWLPLLADTDEVMQLELNLQRLVCRELEQLAQAMPLGWAQSLAPIAQQACAQLQDSDRPCNFLALEHWQGEPFAPTVDELEQWQALANLLLTGAGGLRSPRGINISLGFPANSKNKDDFQAWITDQDPDAPWVEMLNEVRIYPAAYAEGQEEILNHLVQVLRLAAAHLLLVFTEQQKVDFTEIALRALDALGSTDDPTELLLRLDRHIQHLLVDEFQDTSQLQMQILTRLVSGWQPDDGRTVFLVGDPMQSIYRFRKAEVGLFLDIKDTQQLGPISLEFLQLKENFRSHPSLVNWMNRIGPEILAPHNDSEFGAVRFSPAQAFNTGTGDQVQLHGMWSLEAKEHDQQEKDQASAWQRQQAEQRVVELCQQALATHAESKSPVGILVRNRNHLDGLVRTLSQAGIPCRAVELDPLASRPAVQDLIQLIRALSHPADRMAWLSLLRSPLCGLTLESLYVLCADLHPYAPLMAQLVEVEKLQPQLQPTEYQRLLRVLNALQQQPNLSGAQTFSSWVQECWQRLSGPALYTAATDHEDVEQVLRLLDEIAPYGQLDLQEFEEQVDALYAAPQNVHPAVEVMTIHKSKGLEFESVILYGLHRRSGIDNPPLLRFENSPKGLLVGPIVLGDEKTAEVASFLRSRENQRSDHELCRLLYVALTRARSALHIIINVGFDLDKGEAKAPRRDAPLSRLWPLIEADMARPDEDTVAAAAAAAAQPTAAQNTGNQLRRISSTSWQNSELEAQRQAILQRRSTGQAWQWALPTHDESAVGVVAHAWLERMARDGADNWSAEQLQVLAQPIERQLLRAGCSQDYLAIGVDEVLDALINTLKSERGRWLLEVAQAQREWSLLDYRGRVSIIDLAIDQRDHWLIVDYKTTIPWESEPLDAFKQRMLERHQEQLDRYCTQVSNLDGRPARAALYFPRIDYWLEYKV